MTQKNDRAVKLADEIKLDLTHALPQKEKSSVAIEIEKFKDEFRKAPDKNLDGIAKRFKNYINMHLKRVPEKTSDNVKAALHRIDLTISGRRS